MSDVAQWLERLGLGRYAAVFAEQQIDLEVLPELTEHDLEKLGVPLGPRKKLLKAIAEPHAVEAQPGPASAGEAEHRQLTVMFCDLADSTALSQRLDPEAFREVILAYQDACARAIEAQGGLVARFLGDGILAYFGYPQAHEDDAARGVRAGLTVVDAVATLGGELAVDVELAVRVGICTGPVVVGDLVGKDAVQERTALGETPNVAARLQAVASPGQVIIGPGTQVLVEGLFRLQDLGAHALKGIAEPVTAYRVLGLGEAANRFEAMAARGLVPLIGRDAEIAMLEKRWEQAVDGQGQVVVLIGEPGIGKSRVVRGLQESLPQQPRNRVLYFCSPYHRQSALHPVIEQLRRVLRLEPHDAPATRLDKLEATLESLGLDLAEAAPLLADMLSLPSDRYPPPALSPHQRRERLLHTLVTVVESMAARAPVLMVVEDAHWADPSTRELLELAVEQLQHARVLLLLTARPEFETPWRAKTHVTTLSLNQLSRRDSREVVAAVLGARRLPADTLTQIVERADGVPLYVEELTKAVLEGAAGTAYNTAKEGPAHGDATAVPASLHDSLMARLDRLGPAKELAQLAATLGRTFSHELLAAVWPHEASRLESSLGALMAADLLHRRGRGPHTTYGFKHGLIQDTAYQSLLRSTRRRYHQRIAEVMAERFADVVETEPEIVAHHFTEANLAEAALEYWHRAGNRAWSQTANVEAVAHLERALEEIARLPPSDDLARRELELRVTFGVTLGTTRGWAAPQVENNYLRAQQLCESVGEPAQRFAITWGLWLFSQQAAQMPRAQRLAEAVLRLAEEQAAPDYRLQAHHAVWTTAQRMGEFEKCRHHAAQGTVLYDAPAHRHHAFVYGGHDPGVCAHGNLAVALWALGHAQQALEHVGEAKRLAQQLAHGFSEVLAWFFAAFVHQLRGEVDACLTHAAELVRLSEQHEFPMFLTQAMILRGWALAARGDEDDGLAMMREGLAAYGGTGAVARRPYFLNLLTESCWRAGRAEEARATAAAARDALGAGGEATFTAEVHRLLATLSAETAQTHLRESLSVAQRQGAPALALRAATDLARLWRERGEVAAARDLLAPLYAGFTEGFDTADLRAARRLLDELT